MAKKRKSEAPGLEEVERTLYSSFCAAANSISQLYTQAQNQQRIAFQAGERHALDKVYQWTMKEHNGAAYISVEQLMAFLQRENDRTEEAVIPTAVNHTYSALSGLPPNNGAAACLPHSDGSAPGQFDPSKASVFMGALSSPQRRNMPQFSGQPGFDQAAAPPVSEQRRQAGDAERGIGSHLQPSHHQSQPRHSAFGPSSTQAEDGSAAIGDSVGQPPSHYSLHQQQGRSMYYGVGQEFRGTHFLNDNDSSMDTYSR